MTPTQSSINVPAWPLLPGADRPRLPIVLMYHTIADPHGDPWGVRVSPANFLAQMAVIARHCSPMRLRDLIPALRSGNVPPRSVVITFDDGYVDNLLVAKPVLERFSVPGTVFVAAGYVGRPQEFWWDELERLVLQPGRMKRDVRITLNGREHRWHIGNDGWLPGIRRRLQQRRHRYYAWQTAADQVARHTPRQRMFRPLWELLRAASSVRDREHAIEQLAEQSQPSIQPRRSNFCCTGEQVQRLAQGGLIEIGAHTMNHPSLGAVSRDEQRWEIIESKRALESIIDQPVSSFAYPFGELQDYTGDTLELLAQAGFTIACTNHQQREAIAHDVHRFLIPRHIARDLDGPRFAEALARMFAEHGGGER